jgi:hypothetical protein
MKKAKADRPESIDMFTLANLWPRDTGLPTGIWIQEKTDTLQDKHGPVIRVMTHSGKMSIRESVIVTLEEPPRLIGRLDREYFDEVNEFIELNRKPLMDYWNHKIDFAEFARRFKKIKLNKERSTEMKIGKKQKVDTYTLANVGPQDTNLPIYVYIGLGTRPGQEPVLRVSNSAKAGYNEDNFSLTLSDNPQVVRGTRCKLSGADLEKAIQWVKLNKDLLLKYWRQEEPDTLTVLENLKPLELSKKGGRR